MISRIVAYAFTIILLAAHFSRAGMDALSALVILLPFLLFIKRPWVIQLLQTVAFLGVVAWLYSAYQYVQIRIANGDDWLRLLIILGAVALYTLWSGVFLRSGVMLEKYGLESEANSE